MTQPKKIAIIDKEEVTINFLTSAAQEEGYAAAKMLIGEDTPPEKVASFVDGADPDLVILAENYRRITGPDDYGIISKSGIKSVKAGEGLEALVRIREKHPGLPVFMFSASPQHREEAMKKGATGYFSLRASPGLSPVQEYISFLRLNIPQS